MPAAPFRRMRVGYRLRPVVHFLLLAVFSITQALGNKKDNALTRPLLSRHFLWTPVMRYKHNGLPLGFVLS